MPPQNPTENKRSDLLTEEDNQRIFRLLGNRCQTIATGVVEIYCTESPFHNQWIRRDCGVLCFVKDNIRKNYFFRVFCPRRNMMIWEHEMYNNMEYKESLPFLHTFEGEESMIAFNFSSVDEAKSFHVTVEHKIIVRKRREDKKMRQSRDSLPKANTLSHENSNSYRKVPDQAAKLAKRKRNITKADIGSPLDFKHVSHVGWNPDSGFDVNIQDENLKKFFEKAGVSEKQLQDRDTREFIYDFIAKHGGRDAVMEQTSHSTAPQHIPPPPPQTKPPPPAPPFVENNSTGPPIPPRGSVRSHVRVAPPPPPTMKKQQPVVNNTPPQPPPAPPMDFSPPAAPPPPPLPMNIPSNNYENKASNNAAPPPMNLNSALMESIRGGTTLRPMEERKVTASPIDDSRNDLLSEIRKGFKLKPVDEREIKPIAYSAEQQSGNDLAGALARALIERSKALHSEDDDDDDDEDSNDEDWED